MGKCIFIGLASPFCSPVTIWGVSGESCRSHEVVLSYRRKVSGGLSEDKYSVGEDAGDGSAS